MEQSITTYTGSDGKSQLISEMNNFHLLNALLKVSGVLTLNPNGFGDAHEDYEQVKATQNSLKMEVFARMDNRSKAEKEGAQA